MRARMHLKHGVPDLLLSLYISLHLVLQAAA